MTNSARRLLSRTCLIALVWLVVGGPAQATPPYGDPNQPYDRLPGTWQTYHVKWAKPLAGKPLNVLFIVPYNNSREVVELAQRLDLRYTVIMNASRSTWDVGYFEGPTGTPLKGAEASIVLNDLAEQRLNLGRRYDAIVIGNVSWEVIPARFRDLLLKHVERGAGLVYVSPTRFENKMNTMKEVEGDNPQFTRLFRQNSDPKIAAAILDDLPLDFMPLKRLNDYDEFSGLRRIPAYKIGRWFLQVPVCVTSTRHGQGRVVALHYFEAEMKGQAGTMNSLTPRVLYDPVNYDYAYAILARCVLQAAGREAKFRAAISVKSPAAGPPEKRDDPLGHYRWDANIPRTVIAREDLPKARVGLSCESRAAAGQGVTLRYALRSADATELAADGFSGTAPAGKSFTHEISLPHLPRGDYLIDLRAVSPDGKVLAFASKSFRVISDSRVASVTTEKDRYEVGQTITGRAVFAKPLAPEQRAVVRAVDTWKRTVYRSPLKLDADRKGGEFAIPIRQPLCRLWDVYCDIEDPNGRVDSAKTWVGIPQYNFDDYIWMLIFTTMPGDGWKGQFFVDRAQQFGINANFSQLIYGRLDQLEVVERRNMTSIMYTEHRGETNNLKAHDGPWDKEFSGACLSRVSRMLRRIAETGKPPDPKEFPGPAQSGMPSAESLASRIRNSYVPAAKFASPLYVLTGEAYLSGEMDSQENSCFCELCRERFERWCRKIYKNDLSALNDEWGSSLKSWDKVRGIMLLDAVERNQLPRWVAFRFFMRSRVWTQFFIDWTDMMRRFIPNVHTGRVGHNHYDFTRFRNHMTCSKIYNEQGDNDELRSLVSIELLRSFSGDRSVMLGSQSMIRWLPEFKTPRRNRRLPWKMMFMGFHGFDWENAGLSAGTLGGQSCFTPDFSEPLPVFKRISEQVLKLRRGIAKLLNTAKPIRAPVAIVWSPVNHYVSRLHPMDKSHFSGSWLYNVSVDYGAPHDCLALFESIRVKPTFVSPEDVIAGLADRGFKALVLPYSKAMSAEEAEAIRNFAKAGGLVIADNTPGIYSRFGKELKKSQLADLFPVTDRINVTRIGKGYAAYLPDIINGYLARMEAGDYTGSDAVAMLLEKYAATTPPVELIHDNGTPRRDTLMPTYKHGTATYVGLLRHELSADKEAAPTTIELKQPRYVWDVREQRYIGRASRFEMNVDMTPKLLALLPANPGLISVTPVQPRVKAGDVLTVKGRIDFDPANHPAIAELGQVVHVEVLGPSGEPLQWYTQNHLFKGDGFVLSLPISYSEPAGRYTIVVEHTVTGARAVGSFDVVERQVSDE